VECNLLFGVFFAGSHFENSLLVPKSSSSPRPCPSVFICVHLWPLSASVSPHQKKYHQIMAVLHITEAELARDVHAVLEKVREGAEVVIEQDHRPVAIIKPSPVKGRMISEVIAALEASGSHATLDDEFAQDLTEVIDSHREPLRLPEWD
jgi:hypothetical protein